MNDVSNGLFCGRNMQVVLRLSGTYLNILYTGRELDSENLKIKIIQQDIIR